MLEVIAMTNNIFFPRNVPREVTEEFMAELDGYIKWWTAGVEKALSDSVVGKFADKLEPSKQSISASKEGSKKQVRV